MCRGSWDCGDIDVYCLMALVSALFFKSSHHFCDIVLDSGQVLDSEVELLES